MFYDSFGNPIIDLTFGTNYSQNSANIISPYSLEFSNKIVNAQKDAKLNGWQVSEKILSLVARFGTPIIGLLIQKGAIKNEQDLFNNNINQSGLDSYYRATGGSGNPSDFQETNTILGVSQNTLILGGLAAAIAIFVTNSRGNNNKKKR
jgi:hypothetical protein